MDSLFGFAEKFGVYEKLLRWDIPVPEEARAYARRVIPNGEKTLVISPCSSHTLRNWRAEYYAQVADYAAEKLGCASCCAAAAATRNGAWARKSPG